MVNEQKQTSLISITELRNHVFKLQQDLEQALLNHANELIRDGMQIEYRCINPEKQPLSCWKHKGFLLFIQKEIHCCLRFLHNKKLFNNQTGFDKPYFNDTNIELDPILKASTKDVDMTLCFI